MASISDFGESSSLTSSSLEINKAYRLRIQSDRQRYVEISQQNGAGALLTEIHREVSPAIKLSHVAELQRIRSDLMRLQIALHIIAGSKNPEKEGEPFSKVIKNFPDLVTVSDSQLAMFFTHPQVVISHVMNMYRSPEMANLPGKKVAFTLADIVPGQIALAGYATINNQQVPIFNDRSYALLETELDILYFKKYKQPNPFPFAYFPPTIALDQLFISMAQTYDQLPDFDQQGKPNFLKEAFLHIIGCALLHPFDDRNGTAFASALGIGLARRNITIDFGDQLAGIVKLMPEYGHAAMVIAMNIAKPPVAYRSNNSIINKLGITNGHLAIFAGSQYETNLELFQYHIPGIYGSDHIRFTFDIAFRAQYMKTLNEVIQRVILHFQNNGGVIEDSYPQDTDHLVRKVTGTTYKPKDGITAAVRAIVVLIQRASVAMQNSFQK